MKIVFVAPEHPNTPNHGGIARYLLDMLTEMAKYAEVILISIEDGEAIEGVQQFILNTKIPSPFSPWSYSRQINKFLKELEPDCVEFSNYRGLGVFNQNSCASVCRISTPVINGSIRGGLLPKFAVSVHHHMEKKTLENSDMCISHSQENIDKCLPIYQVDKPNIVIPLAVDLTLYSNSGDKNILFVGRYEDRKGLDILFDAWKIIQEHELGTEYTLHLVGRDTPGESGSYLQDMLRKTVVDQSRIIDHGALDNQKLHELRKNCSISIVSSRYESFGLVVLEAFAYHQLVFASAVGGLKEVVRDGENGVLFEMGNSQDLASKFLGLIKDSKKSQQIIDQGVQDLSERFTVKAMVQSSLKAYEKAIELFENK